VQSAEEYRREFGDSIVSAESDVKPDRRSSLTLPILTDDISMRKRERGASIPPGSPTKGETDLSGVL
jgi:hypothetical protein